MAKIIEFRLPETKPLSAQQRAEQTLSPTEAVNAIVVGMVCHVMPLWVANQWPFRALELMANELRTAMSKNVPTEVQQFQVDMIIDDLKPIWYEIASQAELIF